MNLLESLPGKHYEIISLKLSEVEDAREIRLRQLGFVPMMKFFYKLRAPIIKNPILVEIRGMKIALSKDEASLVEVRQL